MTCDDPQMPWQIVLLLAVVAFVLLLLWRWEAGRGSRGSKRRNAIAQRGESDAVRLLLREGFEVVDRQVSATWTLLVDDEPVEVGCRADLLVQRDDRLYVADVKTGTRAPDPTNPATRRQLLEYRIAFDVDGVLLIDMNAERICEVRFPASG